MRLYNSKWIIAIGLFAVALSACSSNAPTPTPTRAATQTPWIIYVPVTVTPEPATVTPLPIAGPAPTETKSARTPTRVAVAVKPTSTKTPLPSPVVAAPKPSAAPACSLGSVTLVEPKEGDIRRTKAVGVGGDTFRLIWTPPANLQGEVDASVGYKIEVTSKRPGFQNGVIRYISHNKYWQDKVDIVDKPAVSSLAGGESVAITWKVTIIRVSGGFNESDPAIPPAGIVLCGPPSPTINFSLLAVD